ncbi:hypothetical protein LOD99_2872 [Oopsacas minuta]|uniref:protein-tyrosine-phosphatase n=1 Tax=Oopsacas minuta TaxID=111878 RepID=A0AAV7K088_9METZ|nr:hypothetical protein LOD99_2872 [Oopsacas minuta]
MASALSGFFSKSNIQPWNGAEIYDNELYFGGAIATDNLKKLKAHKVAHIMNVANDVPNHHPNEFTYINLKVRDMEQDEGISRVFDQAFEKLDKIMKQDDARVLVHCAVGLNRSATILLRKLCIEMVYNLIKHLRSLTRRGECLS